MEMPIKFKHWWQYLFPGQHKTLAIFNHFLKQNEKEIQEMAHNEILNKLLYGDFKKD